MHNFNIYYKKISRLWRYPFWGAILVADISNIVYKRKKWALTVENREQLPILLKTW